MKFKFKWLIFSFDEVIGGFYRNRIYKLKQNYYYLLYYFFLKNMNYRVYMGLRLGIFKIIICKYYNIDIYYLGEVVWEGFRIKILNYIFFCVLFFLFFL